MARGTIKVYEALGLIYFDLNEFPKALSCFQQGSNLAQNINEPYYQYLLLAESGMSNALLKIMQKALRSKIAYEYFKNSEDVSFMGIQQLSWVTIAQYVEHIHLLY